MKAALLILLFLAMSGGVAYWRLARDPGSADPVPLTRPADTRPAESQPAAPAPVVRAVAPVTPQSSPPTGVVALRLPDGTYVPTLNGVRMAPQGSWWPAGQPWSPIVRKETHADGKEWYVHADGSKTTMTMVWRSELGREDATVQVMNPTHALPVAPESRR